MSHIILSLLFYSVLRASFLYLVFSTTHHQLSWNWNCDVCLLEILFCVLYNIKLSFYSALNSKNIKWDLSGAISDFLYVFRGLIPYCCLFRWFFSFCCTNRWMCQIFTCLIVDSCISPVTNHNRALTHQCNVKVEDFLFLIHVTKYVKQVYKILYFFFFFLQNKYSHFHV